MNTKTLSKSLLALLFVGSPAHADMMDLPNPWEEQATQSVPVATVQRQQESSAIISQVSRKGGGTLYKVSLNPAIAIDDLSLSILKGRASILSTNLVLTSGQKIQLNQLSKTAALSSTNGTVSERTQSSQPVAQIEILAESQGVEADIKVNVTSLSGSTSLTVSSAAPQSSKAGDDVIISLSEALERKLLSDDLHNLDKRKSFFSFTSDVLFFPNKDTASLNSNCFAKRTGNIEKGVKVQAGRLFPIQTSATGYSRVFYNANKENSLAIVCQEQYKSVSAFIKSLEGAVRFSFEVPAFKNLVSDAGVASGLRVSPKEAVQLGYSQASSLQNLSSLKLYVTMKKTFFFAPGVIEIPLDKTCMIRLSKETDNEKALRVTAGTTYKVDFTATSHPRIYTVSNKKKEAFGVYCNVDNQKLENFLELTKNYWNVFVVIPDPAKFDAWP